MTNNTKSVVTVGIARKNISISEDLHEKLNKIGLRGESFDDIIRKCYDAYKKMNKIND